MFLFFFPWLLHVLKVVLSMVRPKGTGDLGLAPFFLYTNLDSQYLIPKMVVPKISNLTQLFRNSKNYWLVVWNFLLFFLYIRKNHPNWLIYFRWVQTTNQITFGKIHQEIWTSELSLYVQSSKRTCNEMSTTLTRTLLIHAYTGSILDGQFNP